MSELQRDGFLSTLADAVASDSDTPVPAKKQKLALPLPQASPTPSPSFGYTEINKLEHCARILQKSIRTVIEDSPDVDTLASLTNDPTVEKFARQEIQANTLLHLVAKLKTLYEKGQLPIFDDIQEGRIVVQEKRKPVDKSQLGAGLELYGEPDTSDDVTTTSSAGLPPLPVIKDPHLRARVFQHKSTSANKTYLDEQEIVLAHNERLEFLGDSVLNTLVTYILYRRFPYANEGNLSKIRSLLVSNKTLAEFSNAYGFDQSLHSKIDENSLRTGKQKIHADIFEAYLGALAMERGYDLAEVEAWLNELMADKIAIAAHELKKLTPINKDAKTELYSLVGTASLHPEYKVVENGNGVHTPYKVHCIMEDDILGTGEAPGLKEAGLRAAMAALKNKALLEKYGRRRLETDRSVSVVRCENGTDETTPQSTSKLPLVADRLVLANKFAKNEVYAYFGKNLGLNPEYVLSFETENKRYKAELKVKETVIALAYDTSKKNAMSRAATVVLENKDILHDIVSWIS